MDPREKEGEYFMRKISYDDRNSSTVVIVSVTNRYLERGVAKRAE
jgi:hypothetical protein